MADAFPTDSMELTHILVVSDLERSVAFYRDVLGDFHRRRGHHILRGNSQYTHLTHYHSPVEIVCWQALTGLPACT